VALGTVADDDDGAVVGLDALAAAVGAALWELAHPAKGASAATADNPKAISCPRERLADVDAFKKGMRLVCAFTMTGHQSKRRSRTGR
jgi:hypothetical protein